MEGPGWERIKERGKVNRIRNAGDRREAQRKGEGQRPVNVIDLESKLPEWVSLFGMECVRLLSLVFPM